MEFDWFYSISCLDRNLILFNTLIAKLITRLNPV